MLTYKSLEEFRGEVNMGLDIELMYKNQGYLICPWDDEKIMIGKQDTDEVKYQTLEASDTKIYDTFEEMVNDYEIDGKKLIEIFDKMEIMYHS